MGSHSADFLTAYLVRGVLAAVLVFSIAGAVSAGDLYKWKDAAGKVHISDQPPAEGRAERLPIRTHSQPAETSRTEETQAPSNVVMLSTTWCGVCRQARNWMTQNGIPFTEYDVEKSDVGRSEYRRLNGRGVPIILVGDQRMNGFSAARLDAMLKPSKP